MIENIFTFSPQTYSSQYFSTLYKNSGSIFANNEFLHHIIKFLFEHISFYHDTRYKKYKKVKINLIQFILNAFDFKNYIQFIQWYQSHHYLIQSDMKYLDHKLEKFKDFINPDKLDYYMHIDIKDCKRAMRN